MKKLVVVLLAFSALLARADLSLVAREPFVGPAVLTQDNPGANFSAVSGSFTPVVVGPRTLGIPAPGWSADVRTTGAAYDRATINLTGAASQCGLWGAWVRIKSLPPTGGYLSVLQLFNRTNTNVVADFSLDSKGVITTTPYNYNGASFTFNSPAIPVNTWVWLAVAYRIQPGPGFLYGIRCLSMPLGQPLAIWGSADNLCALDTSFSSVNIGLGTGGSGPKLRIGCPSLYAMAGFADVAYPADIIPPVEQPAHWYVNTVSGNDANDGSTPATAWKTAAKIALESEYCGLLDSNAPGPGGGDVLTIDTSGAPLVIGSSTLTFATQGLVVQPCAGQAAINCQAEEPLANAAFTPTDGLAHTYQTDDAQTNVVAWENDKWMYHVKSDSYGAPAAIRDPTTGITKSYATTGAALDATPGSFYTDGANLYLHPFGDTNPATDGKTYTRSINRNTGAAVAFTAGNYRAVGFSIRKTCLVDSGDNDFGAYCFQDGVLGGTGFSSSVENGTFLYGDKHCFGSTTGVTNSTLLVLNTDCEQGHPYCGYGGQVPFVSYTGQTTGDNIHIYRGCTCLARAGLIGSTAGDPGGNGGDIIYSHNNGGGASFASITIDHCNFASGSVDLGVATSLNVTGSQVGVVSTSCPTTAIQQTTFTNQIVLMEPGAANLSLQNCLIRPVFALNPAPPYYGLFAIGNVSIQGCTFDLSGITGDPANFKAGIIQETGLTNLTFRNNAYIVPAGEDFPLLSHFTSADTLTFDHNAYVLGAGTTMARGYSTDQPALTFAQWQALGQDTTGSGVYTDLVLQNDIPQLGSPLLDAGYALGQGADFTGVVYRQRDTIGAYQVNGTPVLAQMVSNFPSTSSAAASDSLTLPATTDAGLPLTYTIASGPGQLNGQTLTFTGAGTVVLLATQLGNDAYFPYSASETITVAGAPPADIPTDTPTLPMWGLILLSGSIFIAASLSLRTTTLPPPSA